MIKTKRIIHIGLHQVESEIVDQIEARGSSLAEIIRGLIRDYGEEHFPKEPAYAQAAKIRAEIAKQKTEAELAFEAMTPEDYVVNVLKGRVVDGKAAFRIANGQELYLGLGDIKTQNKDNNSLIAVHNQLVDRTFTYPNGQKPTEGDYETIFDGWE